MAVRDARVEDLDAIVGLTEVRRRRLEGWSPRFWRRAEGSDDLHPLWLQHLISTDTPTRVAVDGDKVVGFAVSVDQGDQWFIDDLAFADGRWPDAGVELLHAVDRPALLTIPARDREAHAAAAVAGFEVVSSYWLLRVEDADTHAAAGTAPVEALHVRATSPGDVANPPRHTFGLPAGVEWVVWERSRGHVVASPSVPAPPIYDPGGTTCVIQQVDGGDRAQTVAAAVQTAAARGDVGVVVICGAGDTVLRSALESLDAEHVVNVHARD